MVLLLLPFSGSLVISLSALLPELTDLLSAISFALTALLFSEEACPTPFLGLSAILPDVPAIPVPDVATPEREPRFILSEDNPLLLSA